MAVISVKYVREADSSDWNDGKSTHHREYDVIIEKADTSATALNASGVPANGAAFGDGTKVMQKQASLRETLGNGNLLFRVTVDYSVPDPTKSDSSTTPTARAPVVSYSTEDWSEPYRIDSEGVPVQSSAGEPFDSLPDRVKSIQVITINKNFSSGQWNVIYPLINTVNAKNVTIDGHTYGPETLRLCQASQTQVTEVFEGGVLVYYQATIVIKYRSDFWDNPIIDAGYSDVNGPIYEADGITRISKPWPLNGSGVKLSSRTATPHVLTFMPYDAVSWTALFG